MINYSFGTPVAIGEYEQLFANVVNHHDFGLQRIATDFETVSATYRARHIPETVRTLDASLLLVTTTTSGDASSLFLRARNAAREGLSSALFGHFCAAEATIRAASATAVDLGETVVQAIWPIEDIAQRRPNDPAPFMAMRGLGNCLHEKAQDAIAAKNYRGANDMVSKPGISQVLAELLSAALDGAYMRQMDTFVKETDNPAEAIDLALEALRHADLLVGATRRTGFLARAAMVHLNNSVNTRVQTLHGRERKRQAGLMKERIASIDLRNLQATTDKLAVS